MPTTRSMSNSQNQQNGATVSVFTPISAPILRSVDPSQVAKFLKERERYELEIESKQGEIPSLKVLPYKASVDHELLDNLVFMGKFESIVPDAEVDDLTDDHVESFVTSIVEKDDDVMYDPATIDKALRKLRIPMHISDPEARITQYCAEFFNRLNGVGYGKFRSENPEQTIKLLMQFVYPRNLKDEMQKCLDLNKPLRNNVRRFIACLLYTSPSPRDQRGSRMPSSA